MGCRRCGNSIKGLYGTLCEDCWAIGQQSIDNVDTRRAKIESPHVDLQEIAIRGLSPLSAAVRHWRGREDNRWFQRN